MAERITPQTDTNQWFIAIIVVMLALVEVLDMTIVSVALQYMKGAFSAAPDQITWTITIYVVSAAIVMPIFFFVPLNNLTYQTLPKIYSNEGSGLLNFFRSLGSSIGVAVFSTLMTRHAQSNWHHLGVFVSSLNPDLQAWMSSTHMNLANPSTIAVLGNIVNNQAYAMAYVSANQIFSVFVLLIIPVVLLMTPRKGQGAMAE